MTSFFTAADGAQIAYSDQGKGLPVLCLSGLTRTMGDFGYLAPHIAGRCRMICMDYRGRGASAWTGAETYTIPMEAADAIALLDHLGIESAAVIGTSRGGLIGMALAVMARGRLRGLCLNDIGPVIEPDAMMRIADYVGRNPIWKTHEEAALALPHVLAGFANVPAARWLDEARLHYRTGARGLEITYDPALRDAVLAAMALPPLDLWPFFDALAGLPLAIIRGANSDLLSLDTLAEMAARRPDTIVAPDPDRAHIPFLDDPESLAAIHRFLDACA